MENKMMEEAQPRANIKHRNAAEKQMADIKIIMEKLKD
jgi:hypothetical protein